ncbi:100K [Mastadenovirus eidoli]|uniref:Shutoff protein n=1 Tax=Eidolon helvum adenovirus TaxID=2039267 RepID=A0A348FKH1_9ADEN|nr:100K [Eidolon helvum adenovirus]BBF72838.1 100K [Eidolon helvum adenovirus]
MAEDQSSQSKDGKDAAATSEANVITFDGEASYLKDDLLFAHIKRQCTILSESLRECSSVPLNISELSQLYEKNLFSPLILPKKQANGTCESNPRLNFYPTFAVPEVLASYYIFFQNFKIPLSCKANRSRADSLLMLRNGDCLPDCPSIQSVPRIFEGLGKDETPASKSLENENSILIELENDSSRISIVKRTSSLTHFAYPATSLPPKIMTAVMNSLLIKRQQPMTEDTEEQPHHVVSDQELAKWLNIPITETEKLEERRKLMMSVILVTLNLKCMHKFFANPNVIKKLEESLHYMFRHGYVKQACQISKVELPNIISHTGILHENRLSQSVLHNTLKGELRRDYIRDTIYLFLIYTWQTAMGVWQQFLEENNVKQLERILGREKKTLWTGFDEITIAEDLATIVFPEKLLKTLQEGLPDFVSQSMMQNFRTFILERSGIIPALCNALPTDFVPLTYKECPPPLWTYTYFLKLANYLMFHSDIAYDVTGEGLMECHCRCNLCTPHRSLIFNTPLLNEMQTVGTFEFQGPTVDGKPGKSLKLTPSLWTSAYLRKFEEKDYYPFKINFYENQKSKPKAELTACVITQAALISQLQEINKSREDFLLKNGSGVYLDPHTGERLSGDTTCENNAKNYRRHGGRSNKLGRGEQPKQHIKSGDFLSSGSPVQEQ